MDLGPRIAELRKKKGWTQAELAKMTKLSEGYIAAIEEGRVQPKIKTLAIIARCLEVSVDSLLKKKNAGGINGGCI